ncbi:uncharacterized protein LOC122243298 [Penaeus japonicus]|uniref:uncharacterized protein LOC122243298 n=1 Tax=Penaeus japonicus TaxID=27405 RepID=UPI001C715D1D|nr:uncharacterized protein LOC122243298 [Penaeus japonicus]
MKLVFLALLAAVAVAAPQYGDSRPQTRAFDSSFEDVAILRDDRVLEDDGRYNFDFETANGISVSESGSPVGEDGAINSAGSFSYTAPDGTDVHVEFVSTRTSTNEHTYRHTSNECHEDVEVCNTSSCQPPNYELDELGLCPIMQRRTRVCTASLSQSDGVNTNSGFGGDGVLTLLGLENSRCNELDLLQITQLHSRHRSPSQSPLHSMATRGHRLAPLIPPLRMWPSGLDRVLEDDGRYNFDFETANGISVSESGSPVGEDGAINSAGSFSYTAPDGTDVHVEFVADENGFQPQSDLLPVAPEFPHPIPQFVLDQIAKAAEEDAARARGD